jgi:hypothetical protein
MGSSRARARDHITMRQLNLDHAIGVARAILLPLLRECHILPPDTVQAVDEPKGSPFEDGRGPCCDADYRRFRTIQACPKDRLTLALAGCKMRQTD